MKREILQMLYKIILLCMQFLVRLANRVGLIYLIFLYQLGSWSSENMMSKDSKNGFGTSVAAIETHSEPLKVVASTAFYSIEAKHFLASKMVEIDFLLYKMMLLNPILKKLSFCLQ